MAVLRRSFIVLVLICLGCSAQSPPPDVAKVMERQVRAFYSIPADVKVVIGQFKPSDFANYDAVTITFDNGEKKQDYDFLLSKDHKTLARLTKLDLTKDPYAEVMKKIDVKGRPTRGNKDAKVVVVSYDDFECPFCSRMHQTLFPEMLKEYGDRVLFIYKDFPLVEIHPWATHAAIDANCLANQNNDAYWEFADYLHANQKDVNSEKGRDAQFAAIDKQALQEGQKHNLDVAKLQSCVKAQNQDAVRASVQEGEKLGINATPILYVNGEKVDGAVPIADLRVILDRALKQAGVPIPDHTTPAASTPSKPNPPAR